MQRSACLLHSCRRTFLLLPAYIVQQEGYVLTHVCLSVHRGYPYPIMLCNITQNAMGQTPRVGYLYPIMLLQHYPECHGADTWGVPISHNALQHYPEFHGADTSGGTLLGGTLPRGVPCWGWYHARGVPCPGVPCWGVPCQGVPCTGGTLPGGTQVGYPRARMGGTLLWGYPGRVSPKPGQDGGTQVGQQEYSLHGGRYASCVHAGGLSCSFLESIGHDFIKALNLALKAK